jgi:uncharacterized protein (TIGR03067 family)
MSRLSLVSFVALAAAGVFAAEPDKDKGKEKSKAETVRAKIKGEWQELAPDKLKKGHVGDHEGYSWQLFFPLTDYDTPTTARYTDWENEASQRVGELHLNADADPMWLDFAFKDAGRDRVRVGIVKFDGDHLRWVSGPEVDAGKWAKAKGKVAGRPTTFEDDKGKPAGYVLVPIKPKKK